MPRPIASLKVSHWFGEELRQWRRPLRTSSATPRMVVIDGTACGEGGAAAAVHRSAKFPYFVWRRRWWRMATALEYTLAYFDPTVVGALGLLWRWLPSR